MFTCDYCKANDCDCAFVRTLIANKNLGEKLFIYGKFIPIINKYSFYIMLYDLTYENNAYNKKFMLEINGRYNIISFTNVIQHQAIKITTALRFLEIIEYGYRHEMPVLQ